MNHQSITNIFFINYVYLSTTKDGEYKQGIYLNRYNEMVMIQEAPVKLRPGELININRKRAVFEEYWAMKCLCFVVKGV